MASWEFLVQKEGDNTWLTLESPDVEILEGRYRMVARSGYTNTSIDVRIIYQDFEALPPVQQVQTRTLTTNSEGLMVVMPYTSLKPGNWQFSCSPQLTSGLLSTVGKRTIQLRVLPVDLEDLDQPFEETQPPTVNIIPTESVDIEVTPEPSPKIVQFPTSRSNPVAEPPQPQASTPETPLSLVEESPQPLQPVETLLNALHLSLDQDSFVARLGQPVILWGRIELPIASPSQPSTSVYPVLPSCELQFRLRDPQTAEPLFEVSQPLRFSDFPLSFSGVVYIPFECKTRLILGEVIFSHDGVPVTTQSFNVVTQVEHLLEAIDQGFGTQQDQEDFPDLSTLDLGVLELPDLSDNIKTAQSPSAEPFAPEISTILPPKIHPSGTDSRPSTPLDLPTFGQSSTTQEVQTPGVPVSEDLSISVETSESTSTDIPVSISPLPIPVPDPIVESAPITKPKPDPEVQQAFQALDLNNRFWSRLNSLAQDQEWSQWVKRANVNPLPEIPFNAATNIVKRSDHDKQDACSPVFSEVIHPQEELEEIVVDDEPLESPSAFFSKRKLGKETKPETSTTNQPIPYVLSEDQPVPDPEIEVLATEIISGRLVKVRVRLPDGLPRIYVKVWLFDRQTRSVVDGPRWLTEFSPNGFDQIETTIDLEVPYSSLEVLFEAISVEMQTQRESNKITIERSVNPPPAPSLPL
ncbi:hypothetical protein PCC9214_04663 [Planktothrix tepida]|uniref:Uncharacterized protein n=2 Tax=Planktothrix TaxID=54304 RepID=A0A1J1LNX1_9CYAN|nr:MULTISPECIES: hypothetical protein [Planktothrix]CAD5922973.1 hypothetical protein NO713_00783 [Planktothrix pseudagardhii]CAD5980504.1 hypothetical protein PCC9214_04663 [Planktothrix tepida]CUR33644.1 conserved hypothetical protein [Planktothrix tepida PCC 9214]